MDIGSAVGREHGITAEQIANLHRYRTDFNFSNIERLILEYADAMTRTPVEVSDALFARLRERFSEAQLVELTSAIAWENYSGEFYGRSGVRNAGASRGGTVIVRVPHPCRGFCDRVGNRLSSVDE